MAGTYMGIPRERIPWEPEIDEDHCAGCGECLDTCPNGVYELAGDGSKMIVSNPFNCVVMCDKCAGFCPLEAISFPDKGATKELLAELVKQVAAGFK